MRESGFAEGREHHREDGGFRNPWPLPDMGRRGGALRWSLERLVADLPPTPGPSAFGRGRSDVARPRAARGELRLTWIGHSTFLLQVGQVNVLTDPMWSHRASPVSGAGPMRLVPPGLPIGALPPIDAVLISHDHYDHLDGPTVRALVARFGATVRWITPIGYASWLRRRGIRDVIELDWWKRFSIEAGDSHVEVVALPVQHWTRRVPVVRSKRLWCGYALVEADGARVCFVGDSGYFHGFRWIGDALGPFDAALVPIGAYEPQWLMKPMHMDPDEAVAVYRDLGSSGTFAAMHWGTFRLTDEDPMEPPERLRAAWARAALPESDLWIAAAGETRVIRLAGRSPSPSDGKSQ